MSLMFLSWRRRRRSKRNKLLASPLVRRSVNFTPVARLVGPPPFFIPPLSFIPVARTKLRNLINLPEFTREREKEGELQMRRSVIGVRYCAMVVYLAVNSHSSPLPLSTQLLPPMIYLRLTNFLFGLNQS